MGKIEVDSVDWNAMRDLDARTAIGKADAHKELRAFLTKHGLLSPEERVAEADRIRAMTPKGITQTDSTEIIRAIRDGRHIHR